MLTTIVTEPIEEARKRVGRAARKIMCACFRSNFLCDEEETFNNLDLVEGENLVKTESILVMLLSRKRKKQQKKRGTPKAKVKTGIKKRQNAKKRKRKPENAKLEN